MSLNFRISALAGAVAMALAGTSMANTNINATTTGDVFVNVIDDTNNTSFIFDTGVSQAAFNPNGSYSYDLTSALSGFLNSTDTFTYSVVSATKTGAGPTSTSVFDITGVSTPVIVSNSNNNQAQAVISLFLQGANYQTTPSTTYVVLPTPYYWGQGLTEGIVSNRLFAMPNTPFADQGALNTSLTMYNITAAGYTTLPGTWDLSTTQGTDTLTYGSAAPVPLPAPLLLLASGLGLMGVVSRRRKTEV